jgi:hypothetical protein
MATLKLIKNGVRNPKRRKTRRKSNPSTVAAKTTSVRRRNGTTLTGAKSFAKRNGLKLVKATATAKNPAPKVQNKRRKARKHRRNGILNFTKKRNGILGDTKETTYAVGGLLGGLTITKVVSSMVSPLVSRLLATVGADAVAKPITEAAIAIFVLKPVGDKLVSHNVGKSAMLGGLAMAAMSGLELVLPNASVFNPFAQANNTPVVANVVSGSAANALVNAAASQAASDAANKVAGVLSGAPRPFVTYQNPAGRSIRNRGLGVDFPVVG